MHRHGRRYGLDAPPAGRLPRDAQYALLNQMVNQQAFTLSALDPFYGSAILLVALIPLLWIARPPKRAQGGAAAGAH